jgi:hypothetical protein
MCFYVNRTFGYAVKCTGEMRNAAESFLALTELLVPIFKCMQYKNHVGGWIILTWILREIEWGGMDWIDLAQDRDHWWALENKIINLQVS